MSDAQFNPGGAVQGGAEKSPDEDEEEEQTPVAGEWQFRVRIGLANP